MSRFFTSVLEWLDSQEDIRSSVFLDDDEFSSEQTSLKHFDLLFNFLASIEPSELNQRAIEDINQQILALKTKEHFAENDYIKLVSLHRYFCNLHHYLKTQINHAEHKGLVHKVSRVLEAQFDPELYNDDQGEMIDIQLTAKYIPQGMVERVRIYCELACGQIFRSMPEGSMAFFMEPRSVSRVEQHDLEASIYRRSQSELQRNHVARSSASLRYTPLSPAVDVTTERRWKFPPAHLVRELSASDRKALYKKQAEQLTFRQKWKMLPRNKKVIFASILAVGVVAIIAAGVFVPGSEVLTIPGVGILTAKLLSILMGSVALFATSAAMGWSINGMRDSEFDAALAVHGGKIRKRKASKHFEEMGLEPVPDFEGDSSDDSDDEEPEQSYVLANSV